MNHKEIDFEIGVDNSLKKVRIDSFLVQFVTVKNFRNENRLAKSAKMKSNTAWKYHLQFFKYFVCQEMNNIIIS